MEYPVNAEAEKYFLSSVFLDNSVLIDAAGVLTSDDFYRGDNREIFTAMRALAADNKPVEMVTVVDWLKRHEKLADVGGVAGVTYIGGLMATAANAMHYAGIIADCAKRRRLMQYAAELHELAKRGEQGTDEIISGVTAKILGAELNGGSDGMQSAPEWTAGMEAWLIDRGTGGDAGTPSGFPALDKLTRGWQGNDLIFLAARPSMGKTALALNFAANAAIQGKAVAVFSLEMGREQIIARMLAADTMTELYKILHPSALSEDESALIQEELDVMRREWRLHLDDTAMITLPQIAAKARRIQARGGLDLVILDYLQLITPDGKNENRTQEISRITRGLKCMAKDLGCPVICLSQLSRQVESRSDKRPMLSDLRESGSIEQDADMVMFLYRDEYYHPGTENTLSELQIAKHRNGATATVRLKFAKRYQLFSPAPDDYIGGVEVRERDIAV